MQANTLAQWHNVVKIRNVADLDAILDADVVFHSPVVHTPQCGKAITSSYLAAAFGVLCNENFRYVREIADDTGAMLEFETEIDGISINGVDIMRWNAAGLIVDFKVLVRPLKAIHLLQQKMAAMLRA